MKKSINLILATAVATALAIPAFSADVTMRISLQLPMKSHLGQNLLLFKEQVEAKSNGDIEVQIYDLHNSIRIKKYQLQSEQDLLRRSSLFNTLCRRYTCRRYFLSAIPLRH